MLSAAPQAALLCWPQIVYRGFLQEKVSKSKRGPALTIEKPSDCSYERGNHFFANEKPEDVSLWVEKSTFDVGDLGREIGCLSYLKFRFVYFKS